MDGADGETLAGGCFGCHGFEGRSLGPATPSIAGLSEGYFTAVMEAYRRGDRFSTVMGRILPGYTPDEVRRMAGYFSSREQRPPEQKTDWRLADRGEKLHRRYCEECHGEAGSDPEDDAGRLAGQWKPYLRWTLKDYLVGVNRAERGMSEKFTQMMRKQGVESLEALVNYYARQH
ncbi:MAG: cytochrome c4 [gamma proteobacterium endosymbiont of Lamellibrachia anaximandri]|nr:cytochrome c4 [gamma proteobacterium endosymbiont of Lamellibrachia anaximandri]